MTDHPGQSKVMETVIKSHYQWLLEGLTVRISFPILASIQPVLIHTTAFIQNIMPVTIELVRTQSNTMDMLLFVHILQAT